MSPEAYGIGGVALAVIAILSLVVKSTMGRQDQMFVWFTDKMNGSLDALKASIDAQKHATEHNTKNLKTVQELSTTVFNRMITQLTDQERANSELVIAKLDELIARDRTQMRESDSPRA